jgi:toxin ParE1/3/4
MKLRWLSPALLQLDRVFAYIALENPTAARRVSRRIRKATEQLKRFPQSGRVGHIQGTREIVVTGLPFVVVYRITSDTVEILRVFHTSQECSDPFH